MSATTLVFTFSTRLFDHIKHFYQQPTDDRCLYKTHCYLVPVSGIVPVPTSLVGADY